MKKEIKVMLILLCVYLLLLTSCKNSNDEQKQINEVITTNEGEQKESETESLNSDIAEALADKKGISILSGLTPGPIEDKEIIDYLWDNYLFHGIASILNYGSFETVNQLGIQEMTEFLNQSYSHRFQLDDFEREYPDSFNRLLPYDKMKPLMKQYFNLEDIDVSSLPEHLFNHEKDAFIVMDWDEEKTPYVYEEGRDWGMFVENLELLSNGNIEVDLNTYYDIEGYKSVVERSYHLVLAPHIDPALDYYFVSGKNSLNKLNLVEIEGNYEEINNWDKDRDQYNNFNSNFRYIGDNKDLVIMIQSENNGNSLEIISLEKSSFKKMNSFELRPGEPIKRKKTKEYGDILMVRNEESIKFYDYEFNLLETIYLPKELKEYMVETTWDEEGSNRLDSFLGYDIAYDFSEIVFSDEEGIKLFDLSTNTVKLIQEKLISGDKFSDFDYFVNPAYYGENDNILASVTGYEWIGGYFFYNGTSKISDVFLYASDYEPIVRIDNKDYLFANEYYEVDKSGNIIKKPRMLNLETGEISQIANDYEKIGFSGVYESELYGYAFGGDVITALYYEDSRNEALLSCLDYNCIYFQDQLKISGPNILIDILGVYKNSDDEINVILQYQSSSNENEIIRWTVKK